MRENTPPRVPNIDSDEEIIEEIDLNNENGDIPPPDDDELEEIEFEELERRFELMEDNDEPHHVENEKDDAILTFTKHKSAVFCCSIHPDRLWAATGGQDDTAFVWDINTGEVLYEFNDHKDTVTAVQFNYNGTYLATSDMAGEIFVFKLKENAEERPIMRKIWEYSMGDMSWMFWHRASNVLIAGSVGGEVFIWRIPSGDCKILMSNGVRTETAELSYDGKKLFVGYECGSLKLWDLKTCTVLMQVNRNDAVSLQNTAFAVACDPVAPLYMGGDGDGNIIFCSNNGAVANVKADGNVECLQFAPPSEFKFAASGTLNGQIAIWDYEKFNLRTVCEIDNPEQGILRLKWINDHILIACTALGNVYGFDARSGQQKFALTGHTWNIYEFDYNAKENILLTASEDATAKIFKLPPIN